MLKDMLKLVIIFISHKFNPCVRTVLYEKNKCLITLFCYYYFVLQNYPTWSNINLQFKYVFFKQIGCVFFKY